MWLFNETLKPKRVSRTQKANAISPVTTILGAHIRVIQPYNAY